MLTRGLLLAVLLAITRLETTAAAKQTLQLSDSYLPVAMQVISHLTDQMAYESKDDAAQPAAARPTKPPTTVKPEYVWLLASEVETPPCWWTRCDPSRATTAAHKPGLYAPAAPPKPSERLNKDPDVVLPPLADSEYKVIEPQESKAEEPFLSSIQHEDIQPLMGTTPKADQYLPPHIEVDKVSSRSDFGRVEEFDEENLQYLSPTVRDLLRMANDPDDERLIDVWEGTRAGPAPVSNKASLSASNLRLLLLYDLLSREAKRQKLSEYTGFSDSVMQDLAESSSGGARAQLSFALSKMVERHDCAHEYANNRAKEMVSELAKESSTLSSELRYLQPLVYKL